MVKPRSRARHAGCNSAQNNFLRRVRRPLLIAPSSHAQPADTRTLPARSSAESAGPGWGSRPRPKRPARRRRPPRQLPTQRSRARRRPSSRARRSAVGTRRPPPTRRSTWPRRSSPRRARSRASASRSPSCSPTSRASPRCPSRLDPEDVHEIMDRCFEIILDAVHRYEGTINQFLGDGVMALFGAPIAHEDHPHRALRAALAIQAGSRRCASDVRRAPRRRLPPAHRAQHRARGRRRDRPRPPHGLHRGRRHHEPRRAHPEHRPARPDRAQRGTRTASPRASSSSRTSASSRSRARPSRSAPTRSRASSAGRTRLEVSRERGLTPLVGRAARARAACSGPTAAPPDGDGAVVVLVGEPGAGKSRLLYEFLHAASRTRARSSSRRPASPTARSIPYRPSSSSSGASSAWPRA